MADKRVDGLLEGLSASFDAAIAREEDEAAADLARSLRQGRSFAEVLTRGRWRALVEPGLAPLVTSVGRDVAVATAPGHHLIPLASLAVTPAPGEERPARVDLGFVEMLRSLASPARGVTVVGDGGAHQGSIGWVGVDHLVLEARRGLVVLPLAGVRRVSLVEGLR